MKVRQILVLTAFSTNLVGVYSLATLRKQFTRQRWRRSNLINIAQEDSLVHDHHYHHHTVESLQHRKRGRFLPRFESLRTGPTSPLDTKKLSSPNKRSSASSPALCSIEKWRHRLGFALLAVLTATFLISARPAMASSMAARAAPLTAASYNIDLTPLLSHRDQLRLMLRMWYAAALGAIIGKERSMGNHHPAGVRTIAMVALGSSAFTLCSMYGFGPMGRFDTSRMASAVASGIGFIGAGVITTTTSKSREHEGSESMVHGLTTAAAVWIASAVGVTCGCGLYILGTSLAVATLGFLRIGGVAKRNNIQRHYEETAYQILSEPDMLRKLIDWDKVDIPELAPKRKERTGKKVRADSHYESDDDDNEGDDDHDEKLISKRYFPEESDDEDHPVNPPHRYEGNDIDDLMVVGSSRAAASFGNETEDFFHQDSSSRRRSRGEQNNNVHLDDLDDDVAP